MAKIQPDTPSWGDGSSIRFPCRNTARQIVHPESGLELLGIEYRWNFTALIQIYPGLPGLNLPALENSQSSFQQNIWMHACYLTRNVYITTKRIYVSEDGDQDARCGEWLETFYSICRSPALLSVCKFSRAEGLNHYSLEFGTEQVIRCFGTNFTITAPAQIYINWRSDRLCVMWTTLLDADDEVGYRLHDNKWLRLAERCISNGLCFFAINIRDGCNSQDAFSFIPWHVGLREVVLVDEENNKRCKEGDRFKGKLAFKSMPEEDQKTWQPVRKQLIHIISEKLKVDEAFESPLFRFQCLQEEKSPGHFWN